MTIFVDLIITSLFIFLLFYIPFLFFRFIIRSAKNAKNHGRIGDSNLAREREKWPYHKKKYLFSRSERSFYKILKSAIGNEYEIFPKVRVSDFLEIPNHLKHIKTYWYKIQAKHVDYVFMVIKKFEDKNFSKYPVHNYKYFNKSNY